MTPITRIITPERPDARTPHGVMPGGAPQLPQSLQARHHYSREYHVVKVIKGLSPKELERQLEREASARLQEQPIAAAPLPHERSNDALRVEAIKRRQQQAEAYRWRRERESRRRKFKFT